MPTRPLEYKPPIAVLQRSWSWASLSKGADTRKAKHGAKHGAKHDAKPEAKHEAKHDTRKAKQNAIHFFLRLGFDSQLEPLF